MKKLPLRSIFLRTVAIAFFFTSFLAVASKVGVDSYEIYLNNKLLLRQSLSDPLNLNTLPISEANAGDNLVIRYVQCNAPGKTGRNRSIVLRDAEGKLVKEWKFDNAEGSNTAMVIPVKEMLAVRKNASSELNLYYVADGLSAGQKLAALKS